MNPFLAAIAFLTKIPVPGQGKITEDNLVQSSAYYPLVGLIMGVILWLFYNFLLCLPLSSASAAALLLALWVGLTGALHLDGLADTFDGIGGGKTVEDRLRIMKDSSTGTFGLSSAVLLLLLKYSFLQQLEGESLRTALFYAPLLGRWSMVALMYFTPYARTDESLGKPFVEKIGKKQLAMATFFTLAAGIFHPLIFFLFLLPLAALFITFSRAFFLRRINGITGDCLGAVNELLELAVLFLLLLAILR